MITRCIIMVIFLLVVNFTTGQEIAAPTLNHMEASNYLKALNTRMVDTTRFNILLRLAEYNILKEGGNKVDLDSAAKFIQQANELKTKIISPKHDGYIMLVRSSLAKERGDTVTGKELVKKSIRLLESAGDAFHLTLAYLELLSYAQIKNPDHLKEIDGLMPAILLQLLKINDPAKRPDCIQAIVHFYQATLYDLDLAKKQRFLNDLLLACRKIKDGQAEVWIRKEIADIHFQQGKTNEAEIELLELLKYQKAGGYQHICFTYDMLAGVYLITSSHKNAMYYALKTIKSVSSTLDSSYLPAFYDRIKSIHEHQDNLEQAYYWGMKVVEYQRLSGRSDLLYHNSNASIIGYLIKLNKAEEALQFILDVEEKSPPQNVLQKQNLAMCLGRCYAALKNYKLAEKYCEELLRLIEIEKNANDPSAMHFVAGFYLQTGQYAKALKHSKTVLKTGPLQEKELTGDYMN